MPNNNGGTIDDLMITKCDDHLYVVINAACFDKDMAHFKREAAKFSDVKIQDLYETNALIAIQVFYYIYLLILLFYFKKYLFVRNYLFILLQLFSNNNF